MSVEVALEKGESFVNAWLRAVAVVANDLNGERGRSELRAKTGFESSRDVAAESEVGGSVGGSVGGGDVDDEWRGR